MTSSAVPDALCADDVPARRAIVAAHGDLAASLVAAVVQITGRDDVLVPFSNRGLGGEEIERGLRELADALGARVVFTDMLGGSCALGARRLLRQRPDLVLVTGANLSTLLDFVFADALPPHEAATHAAEKGRGSITVSPAPAEVRSGD
jgi:PTS system N-acetylgalactosamine-specific IIA component